MIVIDIHGHTNAPPQLYAYKSGLLAGGTYHGKGNHRVTPENLKPLVDNHIQLMDSVGTDVQFLSPRPFQLMHSQKPEEIVRWWCEANNDVIAMSMQLAPERYGGIGAIPQTPGAPISAALDELDRCVNELGFVGVLVNPDPSEGDEHFPGLDREYWYPLYEKMVQLKVPALIHSAAYKNPYDSYSNYFVTTESQAILALAGSQVFKTFPDLKIIVPHGGGSVPYQVGRWRAAHALHGGGKPEEFDEHLRQIYFDAVLYNTASLDLLFKICGTDRCMFGTEKPGSGSAKDANGKWLDDTKPDIESIPWLTEQDKKNIFQDNVAKVFPRFKVPASLEAKARG